MIVAYTRNRTHRVEISDPLSRPNMTIFICLGNREIITSKGIHPNPQVASAELRDVLGYQSAREFVLDNKLDRDWLDLNHEM